MATIPWIRCDHCFVRVPKSEGHRVGNDVVCRTCAVLAGVPAEELAAEGAPDGIDAEPPTPSAPHPEHVRANPHPLPRGEGEEGAARIEEEIRRAVDLPPGTRLDPRGDRQFFDGPIDAEAELRRDPNIVFEETDSRSLVQRALASIEGWCRGRWWFVRAPLIAYLAIAWVRHTTDPLHQSLFKGLNLGIHELGHYVFSAFGDVMAAWGGSLLQCLVPLIAIPMFLRQRDWFAIAVAVGWLGTNFFEVSAYAADAVRMELPLVTPGGGHPIHDWNFILGSLGWLRHTDAIAGLHRLAGHASMAIAIGGGAWLCWKMMRLGPAPTPPMDDPEIPR